MTIYNILKESGVKFTHADCLAIGTIVREQIKPIGKVTQFEKWDDKEKSVTVNKFDESATEKIQGIIIDYFQNKSV